MEPKPLASLSSGLLARKGAARPAMRRQLVGNNLSGPTAVAHDDLGWNDMGYDANPGPDTPMDHDHDAGYNPLANAVPEVKPEVRQQQERIAEQLHVQAEALTVVGSPQPNTAEIVAIRAQEPIVETATPVFARAPRAASGQKAKSAFTLRLDGERHLKLRLACAVKNCSAQQLVTAALDKFIEDMPEVGQLASQLPANTMRNAD